MKRIVLLLLSVTLLLALAISVSAEQTPTSGTYKDTIHWKLESGVLTISGTGPIDTPVFTDYPWYNFKDKFHKVIVEEGVTSIGYCCFVSCPNLEEIELPDSLELIGQQALSSTKIKTLYIPKNVHTIGNGKNGNDSFAQVFIDNDFLENIFVDDANTHYYDIDGVLYCADSSVLVCYPQNKPLSSYTVPEGIKGIGHGSFSYTTLSSITLPASLKDIGPSAFSGTLLTQINLPDGLTRIGGYAFYNCRQLQSITLPASVENINNTTFSYCDALESVTILNPNCLYRPTDDLFPGHTVLIGKEGSTIHQYAEKYGRKYQNIDTGKTTDYYRENGIVSFLPTDLKPSYPVYAEGASYSIATGAPSGYQPHVPIVTDTTHPTYQDIYNTTMEITKDCHTDEEKVKAVMNWLFRNIDYAYGVGGGSFILENVYSVWENPDRYGNCMVFTKFTNFMLSILQIPNASVTSDNHAWSMALIDGKWVTVDTTNCWYYPGFYYENVSTVMFCDGDVVCVIDDYTGIKMTSYGKSITDTTTTNDIYIPPYVSSIYEHTFTLRKYAEGQEKVTVRGEKGSYAETYIRENTKSFKNYEISYEGTRFVAKPHVHTPGAYKSDEYEHWQICSSCNVALGYYDHNYDNCSDTVCDTCGYTRKAAHDFFGDWFSNDDGHWQQCSNYGCTATSPVAAHSWDAGTSDGSKTTYTCKVCGKQKTENTAGPTQPTAPTESTSPATTVPTQPPTTVPETTVQATTVPETTVQATTQPTPSSSPATTPTDTNAPTQTAPTHTDMEKPDDGSSIAFWIVLAVIVLGAGTAVTVFLLKKKAGK